MRNPPSLLLVALAATLLSPAARAAEPATAPAAKTFDVIVYGGTPGGITAAVAAARGGAAVALLEQTRHVGGLSTSGINTSEIEHMLPDASSGLQAEVYARLGKAYGLAQPTHRWESHVAERVFLEMLAEANVEVRYAQNLATVRRDQMRIASITLADGAVVAAKVFIDATYEGDLMAAADITHTFGRESRQQYGEDLAGIRLIDQPFKASPYADDGTLLPGISTTADQLTPGAADRKVMNYNCRLTVSRAANRIPIARPERYDPKRFTMLARYLAAHPDTKLNQLIDLYPFPSGRYEANPAGKIARNIPTDKWELNNKQNAIFSLGHFGGQFDYPASTPQQRRAIVQDHRDYTQGLLYFLGHDEDVPAPLRKEMLALGLAPDEFTDNGNWPYYLYVREARRMTGAYVLRQQDVQQDRTKEDAIALGCHWIDSHHVQRVAIDRSSFANEGRIWVPVTRAYQVPYRCLTPKPGDCTNLLVPVCASASHVAFCSIRVEPTWMLLGQAAGTAAAQSARAGVPVQQVDVKALQAALVRAGVRLTLPE